MKHHLTRVVAPAVALLTLGAAFATPVAAQQKPTEVVVAQAKPATVKPGTVKPGTVTPGTLKPGTLTPSTIKPGTLAPGTIKPGTIEPGPLRPINPGPLRPIDPGPLRPIDPPIRPANPGNLDVIHYNVQFLTPDWWPTAKVDSSHWPQTTQRATKIGRELACADIVTLNESVSHDHYNEIVAAMNAGARNCPGKSFNTSNNRFDEVRGPEIGSVNPAAALATLGELASIEINGDRVTSVSPRIHNEVAILSRYQVVTSHQRIYSRASGFDRLAAKGVVHARLWKGGDDYIDVYTTHLNAARNGAHATQIRELAAFIRATHDRSLPILVTGDFNIDGGALADAARTGSYPALVAALRGVDSGLRDVGIGDGPTNKQGFDTTSPTDRGDGTRSGALRIDLMFADGLTERSSRVDYHKDTAIAGGNPTLSDHAALHTNFQWNAKTVRTRPLSGDRRVSLELLHLEATSQDVPAGAATGTCNGLMDFFGNGSIRNGSERSQANFRREGNRIDPSATARLVVPASASSVRMNVVATDDDDLLCGFRDDDVDINPDSGSANVALPLRVDLRTGSVFLSRSNGTDRRRIGRVGEPIEMRGNEERDERANLTFRVDLRPAKAVTVRIDRIRRTNGSDCFLCGAMDFEARTRIRTGLGRRTASFGPINNDNDIRPRWTLTHGARNADRTATVDLRVREDDDTSSDDVVDINPNSGSDLSLRVDLQNGKVLSGGVDIGRVGTPITLAGNAGDERAAITFTVLADIASPAPPPVVRNTSVRINRIRRTNGGDCFLCGDLDFEATLGLRSSRGDVRRDFGPINNNNDIRPGWTLNSTSVDNEAVRVSIVVDEDDDTSGDDRVDIKPGSGKTLDLVATRSDGRVRMGSTVVGNIGSPITLAGNSGNERAAITFTVNVS